MGDDRGTWHAHRLALERWRDAYAAYLESDPNWLDPLPDDVTRAMPAADAALRAAHCDISSPANPDGTVEHGLTRALPLIHRFQDDREKRMSSGRVIRRFELQVVMRLDDEATSEVAASNGRGADSDDGASSAPQAVLETVESSIDHLRECEDASGS